MRQIRDAWAHSKRSIGRAWNHAVQFAGQVDHAMTIGKRVFGAIHPMIHNFGGANMNKAIMSGIQSYESSRHEIMGHHNNVQAMLGRLRKVAPEIDI